MRQMALILALLSLARASAGAQYVQASQAWVAAYVSNYVASAAAPPVTTAWSNGVTTVTIGGQVFTIEDATVRAIVARDVTPTGVGLGLSEDMALPIADSGDDLAVYRNGDAQVFATATNMYMVAAAPVGAYPAGTLFPSSVSGINTYIDAPDGGHVCRLLSTKLQPSVAEAILGGGQ